ncbi:50S ribosomal protein L17 [Phototrophicus methaneseepsis]|uniref:Large ribosomal subunit protein bL17 n=1 Tax=Phototrophicus methaneseepsis TaxID=2710758 RepID=A0A7S8EDZ4_9CHLR|nr:50S ribosomal protein L17 [Phototrophicus methaneseepsis]
MNGKKLGRDSGQRKALAKNLTYALLTNGSIKTTKAKAQFVRPYAERLITVAKRGLAKAEADGNDEIAVHARRVAASRLGNDRDVVQKLFDEIAPRYADRNGGYTRMYKLGARKGDNAPMVLLELVDNEAE